MKIKVTHTEKVEKEIEASFPFYTSTGCHYYKVISETEVIKVFNSNFATDISTSYIDHALGENWKFITLQKFNLEFKKALKTLS